MKYLIKEFKVMHVSTHNFGSMNSIMEHEVELTLNVFEPTREMFDNCVALEDALKYRKRIEPGAPSYEELLEKYHPEYLL